MRDKDDIMLLRDKEIKDIRQRNKRYEVKRNEAN